MCAVSDYWCLSSPFDCGGVGCGGVGCGGVVLSVSAKNKPQSMHLQYIQQTQQSAVTAHSPSWAG